MICLGPRFSDTICTSLNSFVSPCAFQMLVNVSNELCDEFKERYEHTQARCYSTTSKEHALHSISIFSHKSYLKNAHSRPILGI